MIFDQTVSFSPKFKEIMADIDKGKNPANFKFQAPTENVDGSPVSAPLTYKVYRAANSVDPLEEFLVLPASLNQDVDGNYVVPIEDFSEGSHVIALTATDAEGDESGFSNTLGFSIAVAPKAPVIIS